MTTFEYTSLTHPDAKLLAGQVLNAMLNNPEWSPAHAAQKDNIFGLISKLFYIHLKLTADSVNFQVPSITSFIEQTLLRDITNRILATHSFIADLQQFPKYDAAVAASTDPNTLHGVGRIFKSVSEMRDSDEMERIDVLHLIFECFISMSILGSESCQNIVHALKHVMATDQKENII